MTKLLSSQGIKVRTHHAAAPSRPASGRRLSTSSSKRKVDLGGGGSAAMVKTESSGSSCEMGDGGSISLERRDSTTSSKRPRTAGLDVGASAGRPTSRPGSLHSAHEYDPRGSARPISWGPPPPAFSSSSAAAAAASSSTAAATAAAAAARYYPPYGAGVSPSTAAAAAYGHHDGGGPTHAYPAAGEPTARAYRDPREPWPQEGSHPPPLGLALHPRGAAAAVDDAWRRSGGDGSSSSLGSHGQAAVDLSRPNLPPMSAMRAGQGAGGGGMVDGPFQRPLSSSGSAGGGGGQWASSSGAYGDGRHPSLGGASESSVHRSSMSSVLSERYSVSSDRQHSFSSDPSSYGPSPSDASRQSSTGPLFDHGGRYPAGTNSSSSGKVGLPSFQSLHDDSKRLAAGHLAPFPTEGAHGTSFASAGGGGGGGGPPVLPALSAPRLPSLSEMMAQPSVRPQRSLSPLGTTTQPAGTQPTSPSRASSSRGGRMGLSNLLAD
jgi:hypothetical protein